MPGIYDAGVARARYELEARNALQAQRAIIKNYETMAKAANVKPPVIPAPAIPKAPANTGGAAKAARETQQLADSEIRAARAAGDHVRALRLVDTQLNQTIPNTVRYNNLLGQKARIEAQQARASRGFTPQQLAQAAGITLGPQLIQQGIQAGVATAKQALDLREAQNALKAVSGSTLVYADSLATARKQQILFGGSLQENIEGLQGLVITSRDTGAQLQSLVDLSQRLEIKSPEQGVAGARIALQEAFSEGNITSLARRFEIPDAALAAFKDENVSTAEKVQVLSRYLDSIGISSAAVAGKADQTALAYRNLNAELERARLNAGGQLADAFAKQATGLARLFGVINDNPQALAELKALQEGRTGITQADVDKAAQTIRVKNILPAEDRARSNAFARDRLTGTDANTEALDAAKNQLVRFAATSDEASARVSVLLNTFAETGDVAAFELAIRSLVGAQNHGSRAARDQRDALAELRDELSDTAEASVKDTAQKDAQSAATDLLAAKSKLAVDQFLALNPTIDASAAASAAAAAGYDPQIRELIRMAIVARDAKAELDRLAGGTAVDRGEREFDSPQELAQGRTAGLQLMRDLEAKAAADAKAAEDARRNQIIQTGSALDVIRIRQLQYNEAVKEFGKNSAQAVNAQTDLLQAQQSSAKAVRTTASKGLTADTRADLKLIEDKQARLNEVNRLLAAGHLTELQTKQLKIEQLTLEEQIGDEIDKRNRAVIDAALGINQDAQKRLKEEREAAGLQRQLSSSRFSDAEKRVAQLRLDEIALEQQKRALDIHRDAKEAGLSAPQAGAGPAIPQPPTITQPLPLSGAAQLPIPIPQTSAVNLNLTIELNPTTGQARVTNAPAGVNVIGVLVKSAPGA